MTKLVGVEGESVDRWVVVDTGFGRYMGKLVDGPGWRGGKPTPVPLAPEGLTGKPEIRIKNAIKFEVFNLPTRQGITIQAIPSGPFPWIPVFADESSMRIPLDRIVWYDDVDSEVVEDVRKQLRVMQGPPRIV
jgi:hypothetical protein